jgi:aminoglycoside phosphotransferase (APT) family kinase protein
VNARIGWTDIPDGVRTVLEDIVGGPVVSAASQAGGFSPGTADRVRTAVGGRAFVKAVSRSTNEHAVELHRREIFITAHLPEGVPVPRVRGAYDDGEWVAMVLEDVEGRPPRTPWDADELDDVLRTLDGMAAALTPSPVPDLPAASASFGADLAGWHLIAADPPPDLHPWAVGRLDALREQADRAVAALAGETVVHLDIRADNLLITPDGAVFVVDWPHACVGPRWLDRLLLLVNVRLHGGHDVDALLRRIAAGSGADEADLRAVLAAMAGFFFEYARRPPPPGIPTVREFQRVQGNALVEWLAEARCHE